MDEEDIKLFDGKIVFLKLKNGTIFNARVLKVKDSSILIIDKFENYVSIDFKEIAFIEQKEGI